MVEMVRYCWSMYIFCHLCLVWLCNDVEMSLIFFYLFRFGVQFISVLLGGSWVD